MVVVVVVVVVDTDYVRKSFQFFIYKKIEMIFLIDETKQHITSHQESCSFHLSSFLAYLATTMKRTLKAYFGATLGELKHRYCALI
tara:strand:+ start:332 stop:589 length:258 start_codon:yes stop_codon:yes gene_type:complete